MFLEKPKRLPNGCVLHCLSCRKRRASHVCRIGWDGTIVKACLCDDCQQLERTELMKNVLGLKKFKMHSQGLHGQGYDASECESRSHAYMGY